MSEHGCNDIELRKAQENLANVINGGFHKEVAKAAKAPYDSFIEVGFDKDQALDLAKMVIQPK